jgi:protein-disulfide isomerase
MRGDPSRMLSKIGAAVSGVGFLISAVLMYVAFSVIQATCTWCVLSAVTMALTFILHMVMLNGEPLEKHWNNIFITPVAALAFGVLGWQAVMLTPRINKTGPTTTELTPENPKLFGTIGAPLVVIEFADLTCPHCRESYAEFKRMIKDEGATFEIVWRSFPLRNMPGHEMGLPAAAIGELVAEKGKFFQYVDMVVAVDVKELSVPRLLSMAESLGVDPEVAKKRIADDKDPAFLRLKADIAAGDKLGILQTPTYYVGERGKVTYPAKQNNFAMVMDQPDIRSFWDKKVKR